MSDRKHDHLERPRAFVRIESTLDWYFNFADADLGLQSNHAATVARLNNPSERTVASSNTAEDAMIRAAEAVSRYRKVSAIVSRLSKRDQRDLQWSYVARAWRPELASRPTAQRWFAASSPAVRDYLRAHGRKEWSLPAGEHLLVCAERAKAGERLGELAGVRADAWSFAERALEALLTRYAAAEVALEAEEAALRATRAGKLARSSRRADASSRRPS